MDASNHISSYNCEDPQCYFDLARLRGIKYMTWENKDKLIQEDEVSESLCPDVMS